MNLYAYVGNDPFNNTDPSGKVIIKIIIDAGKKLLTKPPKPKVKNRAKQLRENKKNGEKFENEVASEIKKTDTDVAREVTVKTESGTKTRLDVVSKKPGGKVRCTECKSSKTAPLTKNQKKAFPEIEQSGATVVGKGKPGFPGGTKIPPTKVDVVRKGQ